MKSFLSSLPINNELNVIFDTEQYSAVPDDWSVVVADVRGSTQAIAEGRYRDVNFMGAACITAFLQNIDACLPFSFGGDGAALLIDSAMTTKAKALLSSLSVFSERCFGLELHTGLVPVNSLRGFGKDVLIARHQSGTGPVQTSFTGGGLSLAEDWVKSDQAWRISPSPLPEYDQAQLFNGLTCRWKPIPAKQGVVVALLIQPLQENWQAIPVLFDQLLAVFDGSFEHARPVDMKRASYYSFWQNLTRQHQITKFAFNRQTLRELVELLLTVPLFAFSGYRWSDYLENYMQKIPEHCDYQKLDDTLRMVLDCSEAQLSNVEQLLESAASEGVIAYGVHTAKAAQMTCYVESLSDQGHFHFVDGDDGGYALAAKMLKMQLGQLT